MAKRKSAAIMQDGTQCPCVVKKGGRTCRKFQRNHRQNCQPCPFFGAKKRQAVAPQPLQSKARI